MKRLKRIALVWALGSFTLGLHFAVSAHASGSDDLTITVTPIVTVSLTLNTTTYDFGNIDVNSSTQSATALSISNDGDVTVSIDKQISNQSNPIGWTAGSVASMDTYVLYCATASVRPLLSDFSAATIFGAQGQDSALTGLTGITPLIPPFGADATTDLWFRLDMPSGVSDLTSKNITVRFTGVAR